MKNKNLINLGLCLLTLPLITSFKPINNEMNNNISNNMTSFEILCKNTESVAKTTWKVFYSEEGINFDITYLDNDLFFDNIYDIGFDDNFEFLINLETDSTTWIEYKTYHFLMSANGEVYFERVVAPNKIGDRFHKSMGVVFGENLDFKIKYINNGFNAKVFIAYDLLDTTKEEGKGNLTICPAMRNTHIYNKDSEWNFYRENGCEWSNPSTFLKIS